MPHAATPPSDPGRDNRPVPSTLPPPYGEDLFARALERQTDALTTAVRDLGSRLDAAVADMRDEARSTRRSLVAVILVAFLVLGGALGVRTLVGAFEAAPAAAPAAP